MRKTLMALLILGSVVFAHEFGHFIVAKTFGVSVKNFSIGFGPRIFSVQFEGTEYALRIIPLGGFVEFAPGALDGDPRQMFVPRVLVSLAGVVGNFFFSWLLVIVLFLIKSFRANEKMPLLLIPFMAISFVFSCANFIVCEVVKKISKREKLEFSGPFGVVNDVKQFAGIELLSYALAFSVCVGLFNLLPLVFLDGGKVLFYTVAGVMGHEIPKSVMDIAGVVSNFILIFIFLNSLKNDSKSIFDKSEQKTSS